TLPWAQAGGRDHPPETSAATVVPARADPAQRRDRASHAIADRVRAYSDAQGDSVLRAPGSQASPDRGHARTAARKTETGRRDLSSSATLIRYASICVGTA